MTITSRSAQQTLDITKFSRAEQLLILAILGNCILTKGSATAKLADRLEQVFTDDDYEDASKVFDVEILVNGAVQYTISSLSYQNVSIRIKEA